MAESEPTTADKLRCIQRELGWRHRVYARRVEERKMTKTEADRELRIMTAIATDYGRQAEAEAKAGRLL